LLTLVGAPPDPNESLIQLC